MKCFVCNKSNIDVKFRIKINKIIKRVCSKECYKIYIIEWQLCEDEITIDKMEKRLKNYRNRK